MVIKREKVNISIKTYANYENRIFKNRIFSSLPSFIKQNKEMKTMKSIKKNHDLQI